MTRNVKFAVSVLLASLALLCGCPAGRTVQTGPYLAIPGGSFLARHYAKLDINGAGKGNAFKKFDGHFPGGWPTGLKLPEGTYLEEDGQITVESIAPPPGGGANMSSYPVKGLLQGSPAEVLASLRAAMQGSGLTLAPDSPVPGGAHPDSGVVFPAGTRLLLSGGTSPLAPRLELTVYDSDQLDGWTYFAGYFSTGG